MSKLVRLDSLLVKLGHAASRARAQDLIKGGHVLVDGILAKKPARQVRAEQSIKLKKQDHPWVSRGALKLLGVLDPFGVDPADLVCADLGASTGGFTHVLVERGAERVYAIDVGKGLLAWKMQTHDRVVVMDSTNARHLESLPEPIDLIVGDLSFISLKLILPSVMRLLRPGGKAVILVKPQFEAGRSQIGAGGVVKGAAREQAIDMVRQTARQTGFLVLGGMDCPVPGAKKGNVEYFLYLESPHMEKE